MASNKKVKLSICCTYSYSDNIDTFIRHLATALRADCLWYVSSHLGTPLC